MNPVAALVALVSSVLCVGSFWLLVTNVSGSCSAMINLLACVGFMVFSVVAAGGWKKAFGDKFPAKK